jgi:PAS domain S-box-containing protein
LLIPPDRKNEEEDILVRVSRGERVRHFETVRVRKDGARIIVSVSISPITDSSGKVVGASKIARDITRRRLAEEALAASEERFRQMAENIDEVFWMTDTAKQQMLYVSPAYERIWGRPCGELNLSALSWTDSIVAEDRERVKAAAVRQAEGTYREEYRILRPDGTIRWILDRAFPIRDSAGQIYRIVGVAEDITEKRKLEEQFLRAQRMEAIGALASGLSHDLNNILAPVLMVPSVLRAKLESEKDRDLLGLLEKSAQRGANLIRQLLLFSRGASGQKIPVQLSHLIKEMVVVMRETFPREISIAVEPAANVGPVRGDPTQFHQVLMNLCVNARDAMPTGGKLTLGLKNVELPADDRRHPQARPGHYVVLTVSDTGEGMTPEIQARIFDPFFTTKELGKGTGLGLSTVAAIVKSHEGFVTVYSEPGRGTAFHVYLPAESSTVAPNENQKPEVAPKGNGELVLLVDDEEPVTAATRLILEQNNYRVLVAHNGKQAISLFLEYQDGLRLVLTDVMMPIMGGVALARALRAISPNLPIIATSGLEDEKRQTELTEVGIREILYKPCSSTELLFAVKRELDRN